MNTYTFHRSFSKAGPANYLDLFEGAYGVNKKLTVAYLEWLYRDNPSGQVLGFDAFLGDELVAHYATVPRRYMVDGNELIGLLSVNTATHPDHQGRGLFTRLANATYELGAELGFNFVIGVANAQSAPGFTKKLGFELLGQLRLAFMQRPCVIDGKSPHLVESVNWLRWRLSNPSAAYYTTPIGRDQRVIHTLKGPANFAIGRISTATLEATKLNLAQRTFPGSLSFTPVFPASGALLLPKRFQPSPWYVILRPLLADIKAMNFVQMNGLAMDTF